MNDFLKGQIDAYCYMIQRGKPAAMLPVQKRYAVDATNLVKIYGLKTHIENLSEDWYEFWIYKHPHVLEIIKVLQQISDETLKHWILGKLFDYSDEAIREFLSTKV